MDSVQKKEKGITLIALIMTIIVMIILAGVTVSIVINGDLFKNANRAKEEYQKASEEEYLYSIIIEVKIRNRGMIPIDQLEEAIKEDMQKEEGVVKDYEMQGNSSILITTKGNNEFEYDGIELLYIGKAGRPKFREGDILFDLNPSTYTSGNVEVTITTIKEYNIQYKIDEEGDWTNYTDKFEVDKNCVILARLYNDLGESQDSATITISLIDKDAPTIEIINTNSTTNSISLTVEAKDGLSGVKELWFTKDDWITTQKIEIPDNDILKEVVREYAYTNLLDNSSYTIKCKALDNVYDEKNISEEASIVLKTGEMPIGTGNIIITPSTTSWAKSVTITIETSMEGYEIQYSIDEGSTWKNYTPNFSITNNCTIMARLTDGVNSGSTAILDIRNIDNTPPTTNIVNNKTYEGSTTITFADNSGTATATLDGTTVTSGTKVTKGGSHTLKVTDAAGNSITVTFNITIPTGAGNIGIKPSTTSWAKSVTITIETPIEGYTIQYSIDEGSTWKNYTQNFSVNNNCTIMARLTDGVNSGSTAILDIRNIDNTPPTTNIVNNKTYEESTTVTFADNSGVVTAKLDGTTITSGTVVTKSGNHTLVVTDAAGNSITVIFRITEDGIVPYALTNLADGIYTKTVNGESYEVEVINCYEADKTIENNSQGRLGSPSSVNTRMVIAIYHGNLTINSGVTVTAVDNGSGYNGPKGLYICVKGTLTNNGTITMTSRGATCEGQDVYLVGTTEYVPDVGSPGGEGYTAAHTSTSTGVRGKVGENGDSGASRSTGGRRSTVVHGLTKILAQVQRLLVAQVVLELHTQVVLAAAELLVTIVHLLLQVTVRLSVVLEATAGRLAVALDVLLLEEAGNAGGNGWNSYDTANGEADTKFSGLKGTGGLLIIYGSNVINNGTISSNGTSGPTTTTYTSNSVTYYCHAGGGGSGGGSINIFYKNNLTEGTISATGGAGGSASSSTYTGYKGGTGRKWKHY